MSARFLFACWPFPGHFFPQMSIASALRERGDEVAFYTGNDAQEYLDPEGFTFFAFRAVEEESWRRVQEREHAVGTRRQSLRVGHQAFRNWLVETIPGQVTDLEAVIESWRPDVIVTDVSMWGPSLILWEALQVPVAIFSFVGPMIPGPDAPPWGFGLKPPRTPAARVGARLLGGATDLAARGLRQRVDELRAERGLDPLGCSVNAWTARLPLYLSATVPALDYNRRDLPASVAYVGPCVWNPPTPPDTAAWLDALPDDRPVVYVTEGTAHYQDPFVLRSAVEGLAGAPMEVVVTTGKQRDPEALGLAVTPPNVRLTQFVSLVDVLPHCAAVVTTGGPATITGALQAGLPLVVVPTTWDKPDNARRVVDAGVGVRLAPRRCNPATLRAAVEHVLDEPGFRARAKAMSERLAEAPGPLGAALRLQDLASRVPT